MKKIVVMDEGWDKEIQEYVERGNKAAAAAASKEKPKGKTPQGQSKAELPSDQK